MLHKSTVVPFFFRIALLSHRHTPLLPYKLLSYVKGSPAFQMLYMKLSHYGKHAHKKSVHFFLKFQMVYTEILATS